MIAENILQIQVHMISTRLARTLSDFWNYLLDVLFMSPWAMLSAGKGIVTWEKFLEKTFHC